MELLEFLAQQELDEANAFLKKFRGDSHLAGLLYVWGVLWFAASLILVLVDWPQHERSIWTAICGVAVCIWGYALTIRSRINFRKMQSHFIKLQRAGYALYKDQEFAFDKFIAVKESKFTKYAPTDFEQVTIRSRLWL